MLWFSCCIDDITQAAGWGCSTHWNQRFLNKRQLNICVGPQSVFSKPQKLSLQTSKLKSQWQWEHWTIGGELWEVLDSHQVSQVLMTKWRACITIVTGYNILHFMHLSAYLHMCKHISYMCVQKHDHMIDLVQCTCTMNVYMNGVVYAKAKLPDLKIGYGAVCVP